MAKRLPSICIDENLSSDVADQFRSAGFRVFEVSKHLGLRGRDEHEFIHDLLSQNAVFVTADAKFVGEVVDHPIPHAGIVFVEQTASPQDKEWFSSFAAQGIIGRCVNSPRAFAGRIVYNAVDGIRVIFRGQETLAYSWTALQHRADGHEVQRVR